MDTIQQVPRPKVPESGTEPELPNWLKVLFYIVDGKYVIKIIKQFLWTAAIFFLFMVKIGLIETPPIPIPTGLKKFFEDDKSKNKFWPNKASLEQATKLLDQQQKLNTTLLLYVIIAKEGDELNQIAYESNQEPQLMRRLNSHIIDDKKIIAGETPIIMIARGAVTNEATGSIAHIAAKNRVSLQLLLEANYLTLDYAKKGARILIPYQHGKRNF
ncbi:hypothetical protein [Spirosoma oryzicola]|uniref:hypothetical protein n=1 Tax=Spirosoma oryzicola TaxID=2898794 RepID=UPI001E2D5152|nr:hypothetical protein [Spirosoma oryzicola]UHG91802.1 hypothetical protein LQ777_02625 [Spirosoma oryzicola]